MVCKRQVLGPGALGRPRGIRWRGRWEWESGWGIHVTPWLIHVESKKKKRQEQCGIFKRSRYKYMSIYTNPMVIRNQKTRTDTQKLEGSTSILLRKLSNHKEKSKKKKWKERNYNK